MKSIKELAAELNVNERTVRRHISKLNIRTQKQGTKQLIDADAQEMLRKAIADNVCGQSDNIADSESGQSDTENSLNNSDKSGQSDNKNGQSDNIADSIHSIELYKNKAEMLQQQVEQMQKHIDSLNYDKEQLYKQIETLSAALTNAQALQGIEKHQRFIESKSDADATEQEQQPQRQSIFARLFRKKTR